MTRYRRYSNPYSIDIQRYSIYHRDTPHKHRRNLQVGDEVSLTIDDMDNQGCGVARYHGLKVVVPKAVPGERVRVRIIRIDKGVAHATVIKRIAEPKR